MLCKELLHSTFLGNNDNRKVSVHVLYKCNHCRPNNIVHVFFSNIFYLQVVESKDAEAVDMTVQLYIFL